VQQPPSGDLGAPPPAAPSEPSAVQPAPDAGAIGSPASSPGTQSLRAWASRAVTLVLGILAAIVLAAGVGPLFLPYKALPVLSGSMSPTIPTGSEVVLTPIQASAVKVGDVITFSEPGRTDVLVTHRVVHIASNSGSRFFITKGDANAVSDPWQVPATGAGWKVLFSIPALGFALGSASQPLGRLLLIAIPAGFLAWTFLPDVFRRQPRPERS